MSVENVNVIDFVSIDKNDNVVLTISDHLEWDEENKHLLLLQDKINQYLVCIEGGSLLESYPIAKDRNIIIEIVSKFSPNRDGFMFFSRVKEVIESAGYG